MACQLIFLSGPRAGAGVRVERSPFSIGRDPRCDLAFEPTRNLTVSAQHAQIVAEGGQHRLRDSSTNGTLINGQPQTDAILRGGEVIELGAGGPRLRFVLLEEGGISEGAAGTTLPVEQGGGAAGEPSDVAEPAEDEIVSEVTVVLKRAGVEEPLTFTQQVIRMGRDALADVSFDLHTDLLVSYNHAKIMALEGRAVLFDSESTNGTYVSGRRINRHDLKGGEEIELGQGGPCLRVVSVSSQQVAKQRTTVSPKAEGETIFAGAAATAKDLSLGEASLLGEYPAAGRMTIGRHPDSTIILDSLFVSSTHAIIERGQDGVMTLRDAGSANGVYVGGERAVEAAIIAGTEFVVGPYVLKFTGAEVLVFDTRTRTWVDADNLCFVDARTRRNYLDHVSLKIQPGEFVCILGPSGCGKSTLLKGLNGCSRADSGVVLMNNIDFYGNYEQLKHQVGYVPQDDIIHPQLSAWRTLQYAARLRLPAGTDRGSRDARIQDVLSVLELFDHRHKPIHKLSGGQRKRVSIAVELLTDPAIIYLDEPTSGLDPNLEEKMMLLFREMTLQGKTVATVTHTLDNIHLADKITFLVDGKLAFFGSDADARAFFQVEQLPDIYKRFEERRGDLDALRQEFERSPTYAANIGDPLARSEEETARPRRQPRRGKKMGPGAIRQFGVLSGRYLEVLTRDVRNTAILLLQAPLVALFICLAVTTDQPDRGPTSTMFLIMSLSALWFGCSNAARELTKEAAIYRRERMVNLRVIPYVASKFFVLQFLALLQVTMMLGIVFLLRPGHVLDEPPQACVRWGIQACSALILQGVPGGFWPHLLNLYLTALNGIGLGLLVSALVGNSDKAMSLVPLVLIPQVLFAGSFGIPQHDETIKRGVGYAMSLNWSLDQAKRVAMCTPQQEKGKAGCARCIHAHDPFKHRLLKTEDQADDAHCKAVLPVVGQMSQFPESLQVVEDGLYTPASAHGKGLARQATRSSRGFFFLGGYSLALFVLVCVFVRLKDRKR